MAPPASGAGPSSKLTAPLERTIKRFQKNRGLKPGGLLNPKGPTIRKLEGEGGFAGKGKAEVTDLLGQMEDNAPKAAGVLRNQLAQKLDPANRGLLFASAAIRRMAEDDDSPNDKPEAEIKAKKQEIEELKAKKGGSGIDGSLPIFKRPNNPMDALRKIIDLAFWVNKQQGRQRKDLDDFDAVKAQIAKLEAEIKALETKVDELKERKKERKGMLSRSRNHTITA